MNIRLNKYLSSCGIASRRKADELIKDKKVSVNGKIVSELGISINPYSDVISIGNKKIIPQKHRYIALNKPRLYLTTLVAEEDGKKSIVSLISDIKERVFPIGRLDYDTNGLLLLTNDGEFANRIHHPRYKIEKIYLAKVLGFVDNNKLKLISKGTEVDKKFIKPDFINLIYANEHYSEVKISFHEGKKHLVKKYLLSFGHKVERLKRVGIGSIKLGKLPSGKWRDLTKNELIKLKKQTGLEDK